jgi:hypothetical protein
MKFISSIWISFILLLTCSYCKCANQFQFAVVSVLEFLTLLTLAVIDILFMLIFILLTSIKICYCNEMLVGAISFGLINCILWKPTHRPVSVKISMPLFSYSPHIYVLYKSVKLLSLRPVSSCYNLILTTFADQRPIHEVLNFKSIESVIFWNVTLQFGTYIPTFQRNLLPPFAVKEEVAGSSETLVPIYLPCYWCHTLQGRKL